MLGTSFTIISCNVPQNKTVYELQSMIYPTMYSADRPTLYSLFTEKCFQNNFSSNCYKLYLPCDPILLVFVFTGKSYNGDINFTVVVSPGDDLWLLHRPPMT
jgi:hypothetical protein